MPETLSWFVKLATFPYEKQEMGFNDLNRYAILEAMAEE
jgi:hypothetical protein